MLRSHGMFNPCLLPGCQVRVNTRNINKVEAEKVEFIARIKHTNRFQVIKQTMVEIDIHISPHTFNPLIVHTLPTITVLLPGPRSGCIRRYIATSTFSPPLSIRMRDGRPYLVTPSWNSLKTVPAQLSLEQCR